MVELESSDVGGTSGPFIGGVSWQIVPENMGELMGRPGAFENMMVMKKLEIAGF